MYLISTITAVNRTLSLLTCRVEVGKVIGAVLGGVGSCWSVVPTQPAVPASTADQTCDTNTAVITMITGVLFM